jgi:D-alanine-D-alanine ligase
MPTVPQRVLLLSDLSINPPEGGDYSGLLPKDDMQTDRQIAKALRSKGYDTRFFGLFNDIESLIKVIKEYEPHVVFNMVESFNNDRDLHPNVIAFLELMGVKFTGAGPTSLRICRDKGLTKEILSFHDVRVPQFMISQKSYPYKNINIPFPAIVKPLNLEGSEGIAQSSFVENEKDAIERIQFIHEKHQTDAIIEEYVDGRELYVGVLGNIKLTVFQPRELFFSELTEDDPKMYTYKAKWNKKYRKKWGIRTMPMRPYEDPLKSQIEEMCKKVYKIFNIKGYARIDLRINSENEIFFIEANPNAAIDKHEDFAKSAEKHGLTYEDLLDQIVKLGMGY